MSNSEYLSDAYHMFAKSFTQSGLAPRQSLKLPLGGILSGSVISEYLAETTLPDDDEALLADFSLFLRDGNATVSERYGGDMKLSMSAYAVLRNAPDCETNPLNAVLRSYIQERIVDNHDAARVALTTSRALAEQTEDYFKEHYDYTRLWCLLARTLGVTLP